VGSIQSASRQVEPGSQLTMHR